MLLTLAPPMQNDIKPPHEYSSYQPHPSRYSPPESPRTLPSFFNGPPENSMNNPHRGLPPPVGMSLPPPTERPSAVVQSLGHLPAPPSQWAGADESMRQWLQAKAEEDRRKQEEERTKQETLRLDQRRIEQNMLRESLSGGVPPPMVPLIFAGIGGTNLPGHTLEWAQQYLAQLNIQNQQQQQLQQIQQQQPLPPPISHGSPEIPRETRTIPPNPYGPPQPMPNAVNQGQPNRSVLVAPPQPSSALARLNTVDLQPVPTQPARPPIQPAQPAQAEQNSGPGIFFHHWTPPSNNQPPTPSGKSTQGSPYSQAPASHLRSEYQNTPKKRKTTGGHPSAGPTSQPATGDRSPPFSSRSSRERDVSPQNHTGARSKPETRGHSRQRSDGSSRDYEPRHIVRPSSRQQRLDELQSGSGGSRPVTSSSSFADDHSQSQHHHHMRYEHKTEPR